MWPEGRDAGLQNSFRSCTILSSIYQGLLLSSLHGRLLQFAYAIMLSSSLVLVSFTLCSTPEAKRGKHLESPVVT